MSPLTLRELHRQGLLDELADVFHEPREAGVLLDSIGFARSRQPSFYASGTPRTFWVDASREVENGLTPGGLEALLAAAAELFPHNSRFQPWRRSSGPAASGLAPTSSKDRLRVFLCHAAVDKPAVTDLYSRLLGLGITPWLDKKSLLPGETWELAIRRAVRASHVVIVCLSQAFVTGPGFRQKEVKLALDVFDEQSEGTIFLIPARLEPCALPERLQPFHAVNLYEKDGFADLERSLRARAAGLGLAVREA